jgi:hypothetical protein
MPHTLRNYSVLLNDVVFIFNHKEINLPQINRSSRSFLFKPQITVLFYFFVFLVLVVNNVLFISVVIFFTPNFCLFKLKTPFCHGTSRSLRGVSHPLASVSHRRVPPVVRSGERFIRWAEWVVHRLPPVIRGFCESSATGNKPLVPLSGSSATRGFFCRKLWHIIQSPRHTPPPSDMKQSHPNIHNSLFTMATQPA